MAVSTQKLKARIHKLETALRHAARNDKTEYCHHEPRPWDGKTPREKGRGTRWLTPREIARQALDEPDLATLSELLISDD